MSMTRHLKIKLRVIITVSRQIQACFGNDVVTGAAGPYRTLRIYYRRPTLAAFSKFVHSTELLCR